MGYWDYESREMADAAYDRAEEHAEFCQDRDEECRGCPRRRRCTDCSIEIAPLEHPCYACGVEEGAAYFLGRLLCDDCYGALKEGRMIEDRCDFADPGGNSALRAAGPGNPRCHPCPTCGEPDRLTPIDVARGYQCDGCADRAERGWDY